MYWLWYILLSLAILAIAICVIQTKRTFTRTIMPGQTYTVSGYTYTAPRLPHKQYGTNQTPSMYRQIPILSDEHIVALKDLVADTFHVLQENDIEYWVTGGTLISALLWGHLMPYDDDVDISVRWDNREFIWSDDFARLMDRAGFEVFYLRGSSLHFATQEGSCVRVRRKGSWNPCMKISFVKYFEKLQRWCKVDTWWGEIITPSYIEVWENDWMFPLRIIDVDGTNFPVCKEAEKMLIKQYGDDVNKTIQSPNPYLKSYKLLYQVTNTFGAWRKATIQNDLEETK